MPHVSLNRLRAKLPLEWTLLECTPLPSSKPKTWEAAMDLIVHLCANCGSLTVVLRVEMWL